MIRVLLIAVIAALSSSPLIVRADFGEADFPSEMFDDGPKSYHDAWCRWIKNECRIRFQGEDMWVEGQGGINRNQYISYRYDEDGEEFYNYIKYIY